MITFSFSFLFVTLILFQILNEISTNSLRKGSDIIIHKKIILSNLFDQCKTMHTYINEASSFTACIPKNINHIEKLKGRPTIKQGNTGSCHTFSFTDLFYAKSSISLSNSILFLDWWFREDVPNESVYERNNKFINYMIHRNTELSGNYHLFDQLGNPTLNLALLQQIGGVLYKGNEVERPLWRKILKAFEKSYLKRDKICSLSHVNHDIFIPTDESYEIWTKEFEKSGYNNLYLIYHEHMDEKLKSNNDERLYVKEHALQFKIELHHLERTNSYDNFYKIIFYLRESPIIAMVAFRRCNNMQSSDKSSTGLNESEDVSETIFHHCVVILGYSIKTKTFLVKDSAQGRYHMSQQDLLVKIISFSVIKKI